MQEQAAVWQILFPVLITDQGLASLRAAGDAHDGERVDVGCDSEGDECAIIEKIHDCVIHHECHKAR